MIKTPYLLFLGDATDPLAIKVARGIHQWRPEIALAQMRLPECTLDLGMDEMTLEQARTAGAKTLVVGVANQGGFLPANWMPVLCSALELGFDLACGLHHRLADEPELVSRAQEHRRALHDVRVPATYPIGTGKPRTGKRLLTVGTDCSVGKMYTTLALERVMQLRGLNATFRATGQAGILIAGNGVPLDAVVADFLSGSHRVADS